MLFNCLPAGTEPLAGRFPRAPTALGVSDRFLG